MNIEDKEDHFVFYMEDIDIEFATVWSNIVNSEKCNDYPDVRLECSDGRYIHAHQSLLAISSKCLREAFQYYSANGGEELSINEELVIRFPDLVQFEELKLIIDYIYRGFVKVAESEVLRFLDVAKFFVIKGLADIKPVFVDFKQSVIQLIYSQLVLITCL